MLKPSVPKKGHRMKTHANARLSRKGRELLVARVQDAGWSLSSAAEAAGISDRTARKWIDRQRAEGGGQPHKRATGRGDRCVAAAQDDLGGDR